MPSTAELRFSFRKRKQGSITVSAAREPRKKSTQECSGATESVACGATFGRSNQAKKQESGTNFPPSPTANRPEGYLTIATLLPHLVKNSIFGRGRISKKGHRKSVASRHRQHHTQGTFPGTYAPYALRDAKLQHSARTNRNPYQKHTATHPLCQTTQSHPQASP